MGAASREGHSIIGARCGSTDRIQAAVAANSLRHERWILRSLATKKWTLRCGPYRSNVSSVRRCARRVLGGALYGRCSAC